MDPESSFPAMGSLFSSEEFAALTVSQEQMVDVSAPAVTHTAPAPVVEYLAPSPAAINTAHSPVVECVAPTPALTYAASDPVLQFVALAVVVEYLAAASTVNLPTVQEQVTVQEISVSQAVEKTDEQIVETIKIVARHVAPEHTVTYAAPVSSIEHSAPASTVQKQVIIQEFPIVQVGERFRPQEQSPARRCQSYSSTRNDREGAWHAKTVTDVRFHLKRVWPPLEGELVPHPMQRGTACSSQCGLP